jgi:hypothetical protein
MRKFLAGLAIAGLAVTVPAVAANAKTTRPKVVVVSENYAVFQHGRTNVHRGQRLDLVMSMINTSPIEVASAKQRCANYGNGTELIAHAPARWNGGKWTFVCEGVDF